MIAFVFVAFVAISPTPPLPPAAESASKPAITRETRPELFSDEPPPRGGGASEPSKVPANESPTSFWISNLLRTVFVLGFVVLLAYLVLNKGLGRLMKLTGTSVTGKHMTLIERLPLGPKHTVFLVEVAGRRYMIGTAEQSTNLIAAIDSEGVSGEKRDLQPPPAMEKGTV